MGISKSTQRVYTFATVPPLAGWEGSKQETSQKTCQVHNLKSQRFRVKGRRSKYGIPIFIPLAAPLAW